MSEVVLDLRALEEALSRCLYTVDFRLALWSALLGDRYNLEVREAVQQVKVSKVRRMSRLPGSRQHGLVFETSDDQRWQMTIGTVIAR